MTLVRRAQTGVVLLALVLPSCDPPPPEADHTEIFAADVQQLMLSVIEPAAETYWEAVGWILDSAGVHEIVPASEEEWVAVESAAWVLAESGHLLLLPGRGSDSLTDNPSWRAMSLALNETARSAVEAARERDRDAVFGVGAELYQTCLGCHAMFATETLRPNYNEGEEAAGSKPKERGARIP